ncbi:acyl-CoA dehydrogenase family protein [Nocardioides sp. Iso805N]|uniref:acyl-CoA dehydrogenase family protein n=1 Tax=Nocardioides sp. Iso805N TaxID=1283287 RepID=UPI00036E661C|nr:acyl-CoA dehydrogenase family protein [Nocardioides sp. Iso805N]
MTEVRERIAKISDFLDDNGPACESLGRLTDEAAEKLRWSGVVKMLQPREYGGDEAHPVEFFEAVLDIGTRAGSIGWVAGVVGVHPWEMAQVAPSVQEQVWGEDPDTWIASPYAPMGRLKPVDGGYVCNGRWSFSSGTDHCSWIILGALITDADGRVAGPTAGRHIILPRSDYEIVEDSWQVIGLEGTGSKDVVITDMFIPAERVISPEELPLNLAERGRDTALYRMPFAIMFSGIIACGSLAIAHGALRTFVDYAGSRVDSKGSAASSNPHQLVTLGEASADIAASRVQFLNGINEIYKLAEKGLDIPASARLQTRRDQVRSVRRATNAVDQLFLHAGGAALRRDQPFQRFFRDMHAAQNHANNAAELTYEGYGRNLFGLDVPPGVRY